MTEFLVENFEGINRGVNPLLLKKGELERCLNLYTKTIGSKAKRPGYATFLDAIDANSVRNLIYFELGNGATKRVLRVSGTKIYAYALSGGTWGSSVKTLTDSSRRLGTAMLSGKQFFTNGVDRPFTYNGTSFVDVSDSIGTATITIASPAVVTKTAHGLSVGNQIYFTTTGTLPTGLVAGTPYYIIASGFTVDAFMLSATSGGSAINTSGSQSGAHTLFKETAPRGRYTAMMNRRVFVWGVDGNPDRLYGSKIDDCTNWEVVANDPSSAQFWNVDPDSEGNLTGGMAITSRLTLFKQERIYRFDGSEFLPVPTNEGLASNAALVGVDDMTIYPNRGGIYAFSGDKPVPLSDFVLDYFDGIVDSEFDPLAASLAAGRWGRHYLLSVGDITDRDGNSIPNAVLAYNQRLSQWFLWSFAHRPTAFCTYIDGNGARQTIFGDANGSTFTFDSGTSDAGTAIATELVYSLQVSDPMQRVRLKNLGVCASPGASAQVQYDFRDENWKPLGGLSGARSAFTFPADASGARPRIRITEASTDAGFQVDALKVDVDKFGDWYK